MILTDPVSCSPRTWVVEEALMDILAYSAQRLGGFGHAVGSICLLCYLLYFVQGFVWIYGIPGRDGVQSGVDRDGACRTGCCTLRQVDISKSKRSGSQLGRIGDPRDQIVSDDAWSYFAAYVVVCKCLFWFQLLAELGSLCFREGLHG